MGERRKEMKMPMLFRQVAAEWRKVAPEAGEGERVVELTFSSEEPVERVFGWEVLDHAPENKKIRKRLKRLKTAGSVLFNHAPDRYVGRIEDVWIGDDRKGHARVRFGKSDFADQIFKDIEDGILASTSVAYRIHAMELEKKDEKKGNVYRAYDWEPYEVSVVTLPADITVGVGRGAEWGETNTIFLKEEEEMEKDEKKTQQETATTTSAVSVPATTTSAVPVPEVRFYSAPSGPSMEEVAAATREAELSRIQAIEAIGEAHAFEKEAREAIKAGTSADSFREWALEALAKRSEKAQFTPEMSRKEVREYSLQRVLLNVLGKGEAGFEREISAEISRQSGIETAGIFVPFHVLGQKRAAYIKRGDPEFSAALQKREDYLAGSATSGAEFVATEVWAQDMVLPLQNRPICAKAGARVLTGLKGNPSLPVVSSGSTAQWRTEIQQLAVTNPTTTSRSASPKRLGDVMEYSLQWLKQSEATVQAVIGADIEAALIAAIDRGALHGSGSSGEPTGLIETSGIGDVDGGGTGGAPTWAHITELENDVASANAALGKLAYITNTNVRYKLKRTAYNTTYGDIFLWDIREQKPSGDGMLNGYSAFISNVVRNNLPKNAGTNLSAIFFGNWEDMFLCYWGGIEFVNDMYSKADYGEVRIVANAYFDVLIRRPASFSCMKDAITT